MVSLDGDPFVAQQLIQSLGELNMTRPQKPNFLFIQTDQMTAFALSYYGNPVVKTPNLDKLAARGVVFQNAYCNNPICASSRFSMMSGQLSSRVGAYDNAAEFASSIPTYAHHLRRAGYQTCLSGKMHFVGPDQLHGFEERALLSVCYLQRFSSGTPQNPCKSDANLTHSS